MASLADVVAQFQRQADSTFEGKSWSEAGWPELADTWEALIKAQIELLKSLRSGSLPKWMLDQQTAYEASAIGRLQKKKGGESAHKTGKDYEQ
jgi:hypothetical protein